MTPQIETVLAVIPLPIEHKAIATALRQLGRVGEAVRIGSLEALKFGRLVLAVGGHGKTQFAVQTQHLIHHLPDVRAVVCAGCAGALSEALSVNDVVVAVNTVEHDFRLRFVQRPAPSFASDPKLLERLHSFAPSGFEMHFGTVASGDEDIIEATRGRELQRETGALAVAWEGAGGARACAFSRVPYLELRGLTDTADHSAIADFKTNLESAMHNVAAVLHFLTSKSN